MDILMGLLNKLSQVLMNFFQLIQYYYPKRSKKESYPDITK